MSKKNLKVLVGAIIILGSIGALAYTGIRDNGVYYRTVSEFKQMGSGARRAVRISGLVAEGTIQTGADPRTVRFLVKDDKNPAMTLPVRYAGIIPDTFKEGRQVVVEGRLDDQGQFQADVLLAKCPSKYEAKNATDGTR